MNHHAAVRKRCAHTLLAGNQQNRTHRRSETRADSSHTRLDKLHRVIDAQARIHRTARRIEIEVDIPLAVHGVQIEQLRLDDIGRIVIHLGSEENHAVHHQAAEHIHLGHVQLTLLKDSG